VRRRRVERILAIAAAAAIALAGAVALQGSVRIDPGGAPHAAWSRLCDGRAARPDRVLLARCARVHGRVLWVRRRPREVHLALIARLHVFVVKLAPGMPSPGVGAALTATGPLVRARNGFREVQAFAVSS
jgi:hypothetical protein